MNKKTQQTYSINIGNNAHTGKLEYTGTTESIDALKGLGKRIQVSFKIDIDGHPYNVKTKVLF